MKHFKTQWMILFLSAALLFQVGCMSAQPTQEPVQSTVATTPTATEQTTVPTEPTTVPTTEPATEPTTIPTTQPEAEPVETEYTGLTVVDWSQTVSPGDTGFLQLRGQPGVSYTIVVTYKSGPSKAKGLDAQIADQDGFASWQWKIGSKTSSGTFSITVSGGGETQRVSFTVQPKS